MSEEIALPEIEGLNLTKGEWYALAGGPEDHLRDRANVYAETEGGDIVFIADCCDFLSERPTAEAQANAYAIAVLPELIKVLNLCLTAIDEGDEALMEAAEDAGHAALMKLVPAHILAREPTA